jgi:predicted RecB family nuclease
VVREAVRISEPRYSIKNVEAFYLDSSRSGEVKTAGESIIIYERFRRLGNVELLKQIEDYNKFDCQSTPSQARKALLREEVRTHTVLHQVRM